MEQEQPKWTWQNDAQGWFIAAKTSVGNYDLRDDNTIVFRHDPDHREIDHVFRMTEMQENSMTGIYIWRFAIDSFFDEFADDLVAHGFEEEYNEVPEESDIERWEERTGKNYKEVVVDNMVRLALENIDAKWNWYEGEWRNGYGSAS